MRFINWAKQFNKLWVSLIPFLGVVLYAIAPTDTETLFQITQAEWYLIIVAGAGAFGVYQVPNK